MDWLTNRARVLDTRSSFVRVVAWIVLFVVVLGRAVSPAAPTATDRAVAVDVPASVNVRYIAPTSETDFAGFLPPKHDQSAFTVAWIGGSESKLNAVSVPGEVSRRVSAVGGRKLLIDSYNLVAPRALDAYFALRAAIDSHADAIVMTINPVWFTPEWSIHEWTNLDVSQPSALLRTPGTWKWALAFQSPSDVALATMQRAVPLVAAQIKANKTMQDALDHLNLLHLDPAPVAPKPAPGPLRYGSDFFLAESNGGTIPGSSVQRLALLLKGLGMHSGDIGDDSIRLLLDTAEASHTPTYVYTNPLSFEAFDNAVLGPLAEADARRLARIAAPITAPNVPASNVVVQSKYLTHELAPSDVFFDVAHMNDAGPMADLLVSKLCGPWPGTNPPLSCTTIELPKETP
jgi:hypothetical protein